MYGWKNLWLKSKIILIIIIYSENVPFFHAKLGLYVSPISSPSTYLWTEPILAATQTQFHVLLYALSLRLPAPAHTFHPRHLPTLFSNTKYRALKYSSDAAPLPELDQQEAEF